MAKATDSASVLETAATVADSLSSELSRTVDSARELAQAASKLAKRRVAERPWHAAAVAGLAGFLVGFWMRGR